MKKYQRKYTINGVTRSLFDWCQKYNADPQLVSNKVTAYGSSNLKQYLEEPRKRRFTKYYHNGEFKSITAIAREEGVSITTFIKLLNKHGFNTAILKLNDINKLYLYQNKLRTLTQLSRETGVKYATIYNRLRKGYTITKAIEKNQVKHLPENCAKIRYGNYHVFSNGEIYNIEKERFLNPSTRHGNGQKTVTLYHDNKSETIMVKELVARLFLNKKKSDSVGFKNGDTSDCSVDNLLLCKRNELNKINQFRSNPLYLISKNRGTVIRKFFTCEEALAYLQCSYGTLNNKIRYRKVIKNKFLLIRKKNYRYYDPEKETT